MGTGEELLQQVIAMLDEQRSQARTARTAGRDLSRHQARERIGMMREAADFELAASVVKGASTAASGAFGGEAATYTEVAGSTGSSALGWLSAQSKADAEQHGLRSQIATDGAEDANGFMDDAAQRTDRALQKLDAILQAQVEASRAAIRRG